MDQIHHKYVTVQGLKLHVADIETGQHSRKTMQSSPNVVVFLHGFPEIWYSWRHQMIAVADAGFRAIAPDYRGYGLSDPPPQPEKTSSHDLINDLLGILDALRIPKVFLIGKDFGARPVYLFALLHPEKVLGVVTMGVPYRPPSTRSPYDKELPEGFYINRWRKPGRAEADFGCLDAKTVVRNVYILFSRSELPIAAENQEIMDLVDSSTPLPPWFTEEDLEAYGKLYEKSGFRTALQMPYRASTDDLGTTESIVRVPVLFLMGEKDYLLKFPGIDHYINSGKLNEFVPDLEIVSLPEGTHFVQEQSPKQVNELILTFLRKHI
ncbi:epoxide hydrolase A [Rosa chinensis]|uniref:epoxide hydrolase A n=1 Tax=Rosa chinensis TaxID=74649 RepID=UPI000D0945CA|nr:epoxide hydrolase A [Rosa chinensis]